MEYVMNVLFLQDLAQINELAPHNNVMECRRSAKMEHAKTANLALHLTHVGEFAFQEQLLELEHMVAEMFLRTFKKFK